MLGAERRRLAVTVSSVLTIVFLAWLYVWVLRPSGSRFFSGRPRQGALSRFRKLSSLRRFDVSRTFPRSIVQVEERDAVAGRGEQCDGASAAVSRMPGWPPVTRILNLRVDEPASAFGKPPVDPAMAATPVAISTSRRFTPDHDSICWGVSAATGSVPVVQRLTCQVSDLA